MDYGQFNQNPIKLHLLDSELNSKITYLIVGSVSVLDEVKKIAKIYNSGKQISSKVLEKFYGPKWKLKLGMEPIKGGNDIEIEEDSIFNIDINVDDIESGEFHAEDDIDIFDDGEQDTSDTNDHITQLDPIDTKTDDTDKVLVMSNNIEGLDTVDIFHKDEILAVQSKRIYVTDLDIFAQDRVTEFKEKIATLTKIAPYRQHLFYNHEGMIYNMSYQIVVGVTRTIININNLEKFESKLHGIPLDEYLYKNRNDLKVLGLDHFKTIGQIFQKHGTTDFYMSDLNEYVIPIKAQLQQSFQDTYQMELFYYGFILKYWPMVTQDAWPEFIKGVDFKVKFPELNKSFTSLENKYKEEAKVINNLFSITVDDIHRLSITSATINVDINKFGSSSMKLNIRNLFDELVLNDSMFHAKYLFSKNGQSSILDKTYDGQRQKYKLTNINSILIFVKVDAIKYIILHIYDNGKYQIKTTWGEELEMDFEKIYTVIRSTIDPVITKINNMGLYVFNSQLRLRYPEKHLIKYTGLNMSIFWQVMVNMSEFKGLRESFTPMVRSQIFQPRNNTQPGVMEYYFTKGITEYDIRNLERTHDIANYYSHLTDGKVKQRWDYLFNRGRLMKIIHRTSDVKIEVQGVREDEFDTVYEFMTRLMQMSKLGKSSKKKDVSKKKKLSALKEQDPEAYDFRRHDSSMVYSRLCQHKDQPVMYSKEEYAGMNNNERASLFKYWNYTKQEDAYFACRDSKKPYISFIVNKHPKNYCLVCCKITPSDPAKVSNKNIKKSQIFTTCQDTKLFSGQKSTKQKSKYIMTYGKEIDIGRISQLPDDTIAPLFKDTLYDYSLFDDDPNINVELCGSKGYYLYGIGQFGESINYIGGINSVAHALNMSVPLFIEKCIENLKKFGFNILMNGILPDLFKSEKNVIQLLTYYFLDPGMSLKNPQELDWNKLIFDMVKLYFQTVILLFEDTGDDIEFNIPLNIKKSNELIPESKNFKFVMLLKREKLYYPIYIIEPEKFFKHNTIERRTYEYVSGCILKINNMIAYNLEQDEKTEDTLDLNICVEFAKFHNFPIHHQFINSKNLVYGILIEIKKSMVYVPVQYSYYSMLDIPTKNVFLRKKYKLSWKTLSKYIKMFNEYVISQSEKKEMFTLAYKDASVEKRKKMSPDEKLILLYPLIKPELFIKISGKSHFGFKSQGLSYYWNIGGPGKVENEKIMLFDPDEVNNNIMNNSELSVEFKDDRVKMLGKSLYTHHIYKIVVMEFMKEFNKQKNTTLRKELINLIKNTNFKVSLNTFIQKFNLIMANYPNDANRIKLQINEFFNMHLDKDILLEHINASYYTFDKLKLKDNNVDLKKQLKTLAKKFVHIGEPKYGNFPNIMVPCSDSDASYCVRDKLVIPAKKLNEIINIFADVIDNEYLERYLSYVTFMNNTLNHFKFKKRPLEDIEITIL